MTDIIITSNPQNVSTLNHESIENEEEREKLVRREVLCNASCLVQELMGQEKYWEDLTELSDQEDEDGNTPEVFEYWIVYAYNNVTNFLEFRQSVPRLCLCYTLRVPFIYKPGSSTLSCQLIGTVNEPQQLLEQENYNEYSQNKNKDYL